MFSLNILKLVLQSPGSSAKLKQTLINIMITSNEMVYLYPNALLYVFVLTTYTFE